MRIRKHAKISGQLYSQISETLQRVPEPHYCLLNQSPWDLLDFSPGSSPHQIDKVASFTGNASLRDTKVVESIVSMKISIEKEKELMEDNGPTRGSVVSMKISTEKEKKLKEDNGPTRGGVVSMKISTQKENELMEDNGPTRGGVVSMKISREKEKDLKEDNGPTRVSRKKNDHLCFKIGEIIKCCKTDGKGWQCWREAQEGRSLCKHHLDRTKSYNNLAHSSGGENDIVLGKDDAIHCRGPRKKVEVSNSNDIYQYFGDDYEFIYEEDESDNHKEEDKNGQTLQKRGKKRGRKPIKARSLKSFG